MTETWLPFAVKRPGPEWKQGYPGVPRRSLTEIEGEVKHSYEGYRQGGYSVLDGPRQSSWTFTIYQVGPPEQHYPLEAITWHAGLPGDRKVDTSLIGNLTLVGEEYEGDDEELTNNQINYSTMISEAVRGLCPHVAASPPMLRVNLWEHNWLSSTSCPSGRIPWTRLITDLEEDMPLSDAEWDKMAGLIRQEIKALTEGGPFLSLLRGDPDYTAPKYSLKDVMNAIAKIPAAGGGSTPDEIKEAVKEAQREGTG